jgi:hypothetical protein
MNLAENLTHDFFLETGARNGKLKVYEAVEHPAAQGRALQSLPGLQQAREGDAAAGLAAAHRTVAPGGVGAQAASWRPAAR